MRPIGGPASLGNGRHFSLAEQPIARRADESAAFLELENGVRAAVEYQNAASRSHRHGRDLDEIPGAGDSGSARGWRRPLHQLVRQNRNVGRRIAASHLRGISRQALVCDVENGSGQDQ